MDHIFVCDLLSHMLKMVKMSRISLEQRQLWGYFLDPHDEIVGLKLQIRFNNRHLLSFPHALNTCSGCRASNLGKLNGTVSTHYGSLREGASSALAVQTPLQMFQKQHRE